MTEKDGTYTFAQINAITGTLTCADITVGDTPAPTGVTAKYGNDTLTYIYSADGETWGSWGKTYTEPGKYYVKAVVKETDDYNGAESSVVSFEVKAPDEDDEDTISEETTVVRGDGWATIKVETKESAPVEKTAINMERNAAVDAVATEEEQSDVRNGKILDIWVEVNKPNEEDPDVKDANERFHAIAESNGSDVAAVVDIDLLKCLHDKDADQDQINKDKQEIKESNKPIKITITLPEDLRMDNVTYSLIRYHESSDGEVSVETIEDTEYNPETGELTFETEKFCPFGILTTEVDTPDDPTGTIKAFLAKIFTFYSTLILFLGKLGWAVCT